MNDQVVTSEPSVRQRTAVDFPVGAWVRANALGLGLTYALFALVGDGIEAMGADHDSPARNLPAIIAMVTGGVAFAVLRRRVLDSHSRGLGWRELAVGVALTAGFIGGFIAPFDFILSFVVAGTVAGALQLRPVQRQRTKANRLLLIGVGAWLVAGLAAIGMAILVADVILVGVFGLSGSAGGVAGFVIVLALVGLVGGAVGGAIEGFALRRRA